MQYDVCVIGAGADGLAAAATLAASGLKTAVVERDAHCGGRCATREFHPGYRASPFVDELPAIPPAIIRALDLARRGTIFAPPSASLALWPDRRHLQLPWAETDNLAERAAALRAAIIERVLSEADAPPKRDLFVARKSAPAWPGEELAVHSLVDLLAGELRADPMLTLTAWRRFWPDGFAILRSPAAHFISWPPARAVCRLAVSADWPIATCCSTRCRCGNLLRAGGRRHQKEARARRRRRSGRRQRNRRTRRRLDARSQADVSFPFPLERVAALGNGSCRRIPRFGRHGSAAPGARRAASTAR